MKPRNALVLLAILTISGCTIRTEEGGLLDNLIRFLSDGGQPSRERVITDFARDPNSATLKYRAYWAKERAASVEVNDSRVVTLIAVAGELLNTDPGSYQEYLRFLIESTSSSSDEVVNASVWALSNGYDSESRAILVHLLGDPRAGVAEAAFKSIKLRYGEARLRNSHGADRIAIETAFKEFCRQRGASSTARQSCLHGLI